MKDNFLSILSVKEKFVFLTGLFFEKISNLTGFKKIRKFRNLIVGAEMIGFKYSFKNDVLEFEKGDMKASLRNKSSDYDVFDQVFIRDEYHTVINYFIDNKIAVNTIIDAGSNIGLTSVKFKNSFPNSKIICLEPDPENFKQLSINLKAFPDSVTILPNALWYKEEALFIDFGFRDGKDWSRAVSNNPVSSTIEVKGFPIESIIERFDINIIDILKIDIEGSEAKIFDQQYDMSFLRKVRLVAIEIHDEFKCRNSIYEILIANNFKIFNVGELTIGINQHY